MVEAVVKTQGLVKKFRKEKEVITAIDRVSLEIREGEIFGLIGVNGAGKTTFLKILATLILPDEGFAYVGGYDVVKEPDKVKSIIGVLAGEYSRALYWRLTAYKNLCFFSTLHNLSKKEKKDRIIELLTLLKLIEWKDEPVMKYSTGMKHKLALAAALLHNPKILFLDEPLAGIDPLSNFEIKTFIQENLKGRCTIIWTSHNLYEIEEMCDRIAIIDKGKIILSGNLKELQDQYLGYKKITLRLLKGNIEKFKDIGIVSQQNDNSIVVLSKDPHNTITKMMDVIKGNGLILEDLSISKPTLQEIFINKIKNV